MENGNKVLMEIISPRGHAQLFDTDNRLTQYVKEDSYRQAYFPGWHPVEAQRRLVRQGLCVRTFVRNANTQGGNRK